MIKDDKRYVQGGVILDRSRLCDICGKTIRPRDVGWAYIQETKTPTQARLMGEQGKRDEFEDICLDCWEKVKADALRPMRDGTAKDDIRDETAEEVSDDKVGVAGNVQEEGRQHFDERRGVPRSHNKEKGRR